MGIQKLPLRHYQLNPRLGAVFRPLNDAGDDIVLHS